MQTLTPESGLSRWAPIFPPVSPPTGRYVQGGFRFLKDPLFFVSSLFVKKPNRMEGLLMVMTLALLVYSVAQRRLRAQLATHQEPVPN